MDGKYRLVMMYKLLGWAFWPAGAVWAWAIFTSHIDLRLSMAVILAALVISRAAIRYFSGRRDRAHQFGQPRSAYPNGDNGFNRQVSQ